MRSFIARFLSPKVQPKRCSANPGPAERKRLKVIQDRRTAELRAELGLS